MKELAERLRTERLSRDAKTEKERVPMRFPRLRSSWVIRPKELQVTPCQLQGGFFPNCQLERIPLESLVIMFLNERRAAASVSMEV